MGCHMGWHVTTIGAIGVLNACARIVFDCCRDLGGLFRWEDRLAFMICMVDDSEGVTP